MTQRIKTLYFLLTIAVFVLVAPLLTLYASGFRLDWTNRRVVRTGLLSVTALPKTATVSIHPLDEQKSTPATFSIMPGEYTVRITKSGYYDWAGAVRIEGQRSTILEDAVLFQSSEPAAVLAQQATLAALDPETGRLAYISDDPRELIVLEPKSGETLLELPVDETILSLDWSPQGRRLLIERSAESGHPKFSVLSVEPAGEEYVIQDQFERIWWGPRLDDLLFGNIQGAFARYDLATKSTTPLLSSQVIDWLPAQAGGYILTQEGEGTVLALFDPTKNEPETLARLENGSSHFLQGTNGWFGIIDGSKRCVLYHRVSSGVLERQTLPGRCTEFSMDSNGRYVASGDGYELLLTDLRSGSTTTLTRQTSPYGGFTWFSEGQALLFLDSDGLDAIDFAGRSPVRTELARFEQASVVGFDQKELRIFLRDNKTTLHQLKLQ